MKALQKTIVILTTILAACLFPITLHAAEDQTIDLHASYVNPLYADIVTEEDLLPYTPPSSVTYNDPEYVTTIEEAGQVLREQMKERVESAVVYIQTPCTADDLQAYFDELCNEISDQALKHTGSPVEGDYLKWQFGGWSSTGSVSSSNDVYKFTITYTITYYTTAEQELIVDTAVDELLTNLNVSTSTDYEKICAIYDYICENVTYDHDHLDDESYKLQFTAYGALIDGTSVCQGYAVLFYRLALELDVDSRLIAGTGNNSSHGWNIVELDDLYYNVDSTWDAGKTEYDYFLKSEENFVKHERYEDYTSEEFYAEYPMAEKDYDPAEHPSTTGSGTCGEHLTWELDKEGTLTISGTGAMSDFGSFSDIPWKNQTPYIQNVIIKEGVTSISDYAFQQCSALTTVTFECSAPSIGINAFTDVTATAYYPAADESWTESVRQNYGGSLTWVGTCYAGHVWDEGTVTKEPTTKATGVRTYECTICDETYTETIPALPDDEEEPASDVTRIYGSGRVETALEVADKLKETLAVDTFDAIIVANGDNFADALAGSYLANVKGAPILLYIKSGMSEANLEFIQNNLSKDGVIYLLGGSSAIPESVEETLADYKIERLAGKSRYETNLMILEEAGINDEEILIATGWSFADSLSASATGLPILLMNNGTDTLTEEQIEFLEQHKDNTFTIVGGDSAISAEMKAAIEEVVGKEIERVSGKDRSETSVKIAERYFKDPELALVAYSWNFPDGLCGGPLAYALNAPLLLTSSGYESAAAEYIETNDIHAGYVLGGTSVLSDDTAKLVFGLDSNDTINKKQ